MCQKLATPGYDAIALQTNDPREIVHHVVHLQRNKHAAAQLRQAARRSAERYTWPAVIRRALLPALRARIARRELPPDAAERHTEYAHGRKRRL